MGPLDLLAIYGYVSHMANNCSVCGKDLALVGRIHRCVPLPPKLVLSKPKPKGGTYRYRDPDKRRAYMAAYMRKRRGK